MNIETNRLVIRLFKDEEVSKLIQIINDPQVKKFHPTFFENATVDFLKSVLMYFRNNDELKIKDPEHGFLYAVYSKEVKEIVGLILLCLQKEPPYEWHIGWYFLSEFTGKGYASEAGKVMSDYFMDYLSLDHIWAGVRVDNIASYKTALKSGFKLINQKTENEIILKKERCNMNKIEIRKIDVDKHYTFLYGAHKETYKLTYGKEISDEFFLRELQLAKEVGQGVFIDEELIGICDLQIRQLNDEKYGWVHFIYVDPKHRGKGIGRQLIDYAINYCIDNKLNKLRLRAGNNNLEAIRFYERNGFVREALFNRESEVSFLLDVKVKVLFEQGNIYINEHARGLDVTMWKYLFKNGKADDVLIELKKYQNIDGGFGHGIELDFLNPNSTPMATYYATEYIRKLKAIKKDNEIILGILKYLESGKDFIEDKWMFTVPSNNAYPHAIWWQCNNDIGDPSLNPSAGLVAFILDYASKDSSIYSTACKLAMKYIDDYLAIEDKQKLDNLASIMINLVDSLKNLSIIQETKLNELKCLIVKVIKDKLNNTYDKWQTDYVEFPSMMIRDQGSFLYPYIEEYIKKEIDYILQSDVGSKALSVSWQWWTSFDEYNQSKIYWLAIIITNKLLFMEMMNNNF